MKYESQKGEYGAVTLAPYVDDAEHVGDVSMREFFALMNLDPFEVSADHDIRVGLLDKQVGDVDHSKGLYFTLYEHDENGQRVIERGEPKTRNVLVRLTQDVTNPRERK